MVKGTSREQGVTVWCSGGLGSGWVVPLTAFFSVLSRFEAPCTANQMRGVMQVHREGRKKKKRGEENEKKKGPAFFFFFLCGSKQLECKG